MSNKYALKLRSGALMPQLGLGTLMAKEREIIDAVLKALEVGYRHIDTAYMYGNETAIGQALSEAFQKGILTREELFITTKLPPNGHRPDLVRHFLESSLKKLQLSYVDLYLVHTPYGFKHVSDDETFPVENGVGIFYDNDIMATWKEMEACSDAGLARDIGVSNFNSEQLKLVCDNARIKPSNNQVECHVYLQQNKLFQFCQDLGVTVTAYAPFGSPMVREWGKKNFNKDLPEQPTVLENPILAEIGKKYDKTSAQVALRWTIQRGMVVIPKSTSPSRIEQNFQVFDFELSDDDMAKISTQDLGIRFFKGDFIKGATEHRNYPYNAEF